MQTTKSTTELVAEVLAGPRSSREVSVASFTPAGLGRDAELSPCGCSGDETTQTRLPGRQPLRLDTHAPCSNGGPSTLPGSERREPPLACASNECEATIRQYCWGTLGRLLDIEHEIEIVYDEDDDEEEEQRLPGRDIPARDTDGIYHNIPRLRMVGGLEEVRGLEEMRGDGTIFGGLEIKGHSPGGIPENPLGLKGPKVPIVGGTDFKAPKGPILSADSYDAPNIPQKALTTDCKTSIASPHPINNVPPEYADYNWRWSKSGPGSCSKSQQEMLRKSYRAAYQVVRLADKELRYWFEYSKTNIEEAKAYWRYPAVDDPSSLAFWFGNSGELQWGQRFGEVYNTIKSWSYCFRHGFYGSGFDRPVYFRCREKKTLKGAAAIHASLNVITLYKPWFRYSDWQRAIAILHEMGHMCRSGLHWVLSPKPFGIELSQANMLTDGPRDRKNVHCSGYGSDKCYGLTGDPVFFDDLFTSNALLGTMPGLAAVNPRILRERFEAGSSSARRDMLDNIDNYVCWMWNRWATREYCTLEVV